MGDQATDSAGLLRGPSDISDLLAALGVDDPKDLRTARRKAVSLLKELDATGEVAPLFTFARTLAPMGADMSDACRTHATSLGGQIQQHIGSARILSQTR